MDKLYTQDLFNISAVQIFIRKLYLANNSWKGKRETGREKIKRKGKREKGRGKEKKERGKEKRRGKREKNGEKRKRKGKRVNGRGKE